MRIHRVIAVAFAVMSALVACGGDDPAAPFKAVAEIEGDAAPAVGRNTVRLTLTDDAGPIVGAALTVLPFMPAHGHGSSDAPVVTELGGGVYRAAPVTFTMPGRWTLTVTARGPVSGSAVVEFTVR